jgi:hypothetical protein
MRLRHNDVKRLQLMGQVRRIYCEEDLVLIAVLKEVHCEVRSMVIKVN